MKRLSTSILILVAIFAAGLTLTNKAKAQTSTWAQCPGGEEIVHCETYDCPKGDTNSDGICNLSDEAGRLTNSRNDSFCANPPSGCGEVLYYKANTGIACAVRVKENSNNCDLYSASNPSFTTPTPAPSATPRPTSTPAASPSATPISGKGGGTNEATSETKGGTLPETGPSFLTLIALVSTGFLGLYIYERFKVA